MLWPKVRFSARRLKIYRKATILNQDSISRVKTSIAIIPTIKSEYYPSITLHNYMINPLIVNHSFRKMGHTMWVCCIKDFSIGKSMVSHFCTITRKPRTIAEPWKRREVGREQIVNRTINIYIQYSENTKIQGSLSQ